MYLLTLSSGRSETFGRYASLSRASHRNQVAIAKPDNHIQVPVDDVKFNALNFYTENLIERTGAGLLYS